MSETSGWARLASNRRKEPPKPGLAGVERRSYRIAKRLVDLVLSGLGLVMLIPLMAFVALLVRLTSPGPALFRQTRV